MTKQELIDFEEGIKDIFLEGKIRAPVHLSRGNEETLIEIFENIEKADWCFSTHRNHYHALLKGIPREWVKAEILAGRSMHINSKKHKFMTSSMVGGCLPIAVGVAMAIKRKRQENRVWCFIGDMAAETGIFHECTKYAKNFNLPLCVVVECNGLSTNTPTYQTWNMKHEHKPDGQVRVIDNWGKGCVLTYCYERVFPHINAGKWVTFK